ncbi:hypothetical protein RJ639_009125 [Escallonia herrerae]|uniref:DNA-directed RNA polymerase n=1 Tax=Escallonia herrerae TaxID=1293975 RepID=A0AA88VWA0_9ASTE|nr:hypothetical protein RJ639_009125 [Escallonia herrerae]
MKKESIKKDPIIPIRNLLGLGPLGAALQILNFYLFSHLITHNQILVTNYSQLDNFKQTFQVLKYYLMDETGKIYNPNPCPTVHGHYGEILYEGDTLVTFIYHKSRSGDITQGLPKVEQVLEVRSIDSISTNLDKRVDIVKNRSHLKLGQVLEVRSIDSISTNLDERVEAWNQCKTLILGIPWEFLIGAELTIAQSRISLVNKIQKVYRSQGVHIHNRHIEIIVHQITSKVLVSEDGMSDIISPRELIGLLRAE